MIEKIYITWDDFHQDSKRLSQKVKKAGNFNKIVAIARGGLFPAGVISYELDIRNIEVLNVASYDSGVQRNKEDITFLEKDIKIDKNTLVIDDLSDTGATMDLLRKSFPEATFASIYAKPQGIASVDIYQKDMPDKWLVFPWD